MSYEKLLRLPEEAGN